ncbi:hypothetical protein JKF63_05834 [Porcisia hertigi]|uniref:Uncharacterized protein n=1 Tax=Porcisia hertigi TaxID=2761500 RepID=A0A836IXR2_9TRYP|nr:hypothetical protein JKF63_05834 [Porcisia hertigi]
MKDSRDYIRRLWNLAEDMAVQCGKPLHAFLLLHNILTQPPSSLRRASGTTVGKDGIPDGGVASTTTKPPPGATPKTTLPLHVAAFDAEWKCEELVTRLRAAEYLLFTDAPVAHSGTSPTSTPPSPHTLSCTAGLEALELAEQVLAPVFATTSVLVSTDNVLGSAPYQQASAPAPPWHQGCRTSNGSAGGSGKNRGSRNGSSCLEDVVREVADVSRSFTDAAARSSSTSLAVEAGGTSVAVQPRVASMYFLNQATVTALAWPLSSFTMTWPIPDALEDGLNQAHAAREDGAQHLLSVPLVFGPANETITIPLSLVVRAHVLQALVCHRRTQHKRALQCLAEARQWIAQHFNDTARTRAVRLLWEDLQERWMPLILQQQQELRPPSCASLSQPATTPARIQLPPLPGFRRLIERLIVEEGRVCAAMVQMEECKIHYAILQVCGALPPPALLPLRSPSSAAAPPFADASAQIPAHTVDLRLHYRRHQESLRFLHLLSRAYMTVVRWIEEEDQGDALGATSAAARPPSGKVDTMAQGVAWRDALRCVRSRLSPFCFCALQDTFESSPPVSPTGPAAASATATTTTTTTAAASVSRCYALGFDIRLAAEVLGLYHCLSYVYLLYQKSAVAAAPHQISVMHPDSFSVVQLMARITAGDGGDGKTQRPRNEAAEEGRAKSRNESRVDEVSEGEREETEFLRRYRSDLAYLTFISDHQTRPLTRQTSSSLDTAVDGDSTDDLAIARDLVHRAVEHAKINAFIFGQWRTSDAAVAKTSSPPALTRANIKGEKQIKTESTEGDESGSACGQCTAVQAECPPTWRSSTDATEDTAPTTATIIHELTLLWCLVELGLRDNYPFAIRYQRGLTDALSPFSAPSRVCDPAQVPNNKGPSKDPAAAAAAAPLSGKASAGEPNSSGPLETYTNPEGSASLLVTRKRSRSPSSTPMVHQASEPSTSCLQRPLSRNWVFPGVRRALQLYLELVTVVMRTAATAHVSASTSATGTEDPRSVTVTSSTAASSTTLSIPLIRLGLRNAEQLMARLLFTIDAEMVQLAGNTWGCMPSTAGAREGRSARATDVTEYRDRSGRKMSSSDASQAQLKQSSLLTDQLQCSAPAQLRVLVQIKAAALVTMARHHLTQLSLVQAVHYLREGQQFARVFHRQGKLTLLPEMHILLACVATCMSLRRLPELPKPVARKRRGSEGRGNSVSSGDGDVATDARPGTLQDALYIFAQGWLSTERAAASVDTTNGDAVAPPQLLSLGGPHISNATGTTAFAILPQEESTVAQDVGLPYLHLLAAERATCTSLHTPPSLSLLLYILKAWTVFHLVIAGEELVWPEVSGSFVSPLAAPMHTPLQQQWSARKVNGSPSLSKAAPRSLGLASTSPSPQLMPLPSPSHATTTLNTTLEDQQRRVARLDSLTSTPSSTPTLRSRHATVPMEMHRIQLEPAMIPPAAAAAARAAAKVAKDEENKDGDSGVERPQESDACVSAKAVNNNTDGKIAHIPQNRSKNCIDMRGPGKTDTGIGSTNTQSIYKNIGSAASMADKAPGPSGVHVKALPHTQKHRARDVLQRMIAVLLHHYETHSVHAALTTSDVSSVNKGADAPAPQRVSSAAWTPQNIALFRLLRGATLLFDDRDELAAVRELKEVTHFAKKYLGVLHPYVADGLALLASTYASLDVDAAPNVDRCIHSESSGSVYTSTASPEGAMDNAARARRVALQLAMRCSCTALASLCTSSAISGSESVDATGTTTEQPHQQQTKSLSSTAARLQEWWGNQVLHDLCGSNSGGGIGSSGYDINAVRRLRILFSWLPGSVDYPSS